MKLIIVMPDNFISVDGIGFNDIDLSSIPKSIHSVQWDGETGHVEYVDKSIFNTPIDNISKYKKLITAHTKRLKQYTDETKPALPFYVLDGKNWIIDADLKKKYDDEQEIEMTKTLRPSIASVWDDETKSWKEDDNVKKYYDSLSYLSSTDWYLARKVETGEEVPADVLAKRTDARTYIRTYQK